MNLERLPASKKTVAVALALSLLIHLVIASWPRDQIPEQAVLPLKAELREISPPPKVAAAKSSVKPARRTARPGANPAPIQVASEAGEDFLETETLAALPAVIPPTAELLAPVDLAVPELRLPPQRMELAYSVYMGETESVSGKIRYQLEHDNEQYQIQTAGEAVGLVALLYPGLYKLISKGNITAVGLQPVEFVTERPGKREAARFDWEKDLLYLANDQQHSLQLPTFDLLSFMLQFYFLPPQEDVHAMQVVTSAKRVSRFSFKRKGTESVTTPMGEISAERWHRISDDGRVEMEVWLAPQFHFIPVKARGKGRWMTVETVLASISADPPSASEKTTLN